MYNVKIYLRSLNIYILNPNTNENTSSLSLPCIPPCVSFEVSISVIRKEFD